jgi:hypothetical protein
VPAARQSRGRRQWSTTIFREYLLILTALKGGVLDPTANKAIEIARSLKSLRDTVEKIALATGLSPD